MQSGRGIAEVKERGSDKVDSSLNIQVVRPVVRSVGWPGLGLRGSALAIEWSRSTWRL